MPESGQVPEFPWTRKLIEVGIPLKEINDASAKEKRARVGHPSTLHLWWARRPLAACRAVLFAQLVDDPSARPDLFPTQEEQNKERRELHQLVCEMIRWDNSTDSKLFDKVNEKIRQSCGNEGPPPILDPFAGGGSIPLEAQRLGLSAEGRDLNPVAVLITKALIEIPPQWAGRPPVSSGGVIDREFWPRATGLAEDVLRYGQWMHRQAVNRVGKLYPATRISGVDATTIAWIWARTVTCPNPACGGTAPLAHSFWLGQKPGKERYVEPVPTGRRVRFEIRGPMGSPRPGTASRRGGECLLCGSPIPGKYIREEGRNNRMGVQLMTVVSEGKRQRYYLSPTAEHEEAANVPRPGSVPEEEIATDPRNLWCVAYGLTRFSDLFTNRQLTFLTTLTDLVREARLKVLEDCGDSAYADAVATYLALAASRITDRNCAITSWNSHPSKEQIRGAFARQAIPFTWNFTEGNPFSTSSGNLLRSIEDVAEALRRVPAKPAATTKVEDAAHGTFDGRLLVATDPPYYDNIGYANLSDFFYVWLRRMRHDIHPGLMAGMVTPKADEIVADPARQGSREAAERFFRKKFSEVFERIREGTPPGYPISFFYAHKQNDRKGADDFASTGWEMLLATIIDAGWTITATWPVRTEMPGRTRSVSSNALASSVVLACRPRPDDAPATDQRTLIAELRRLLPDTLSSMQEGGIPPTDLRQAATGPAVAVFSQYSRVNAPSGERLSVRSALSLINQVFDECMDEMDSDIAPATRWCIDWFRSHGFNQGPYGDADAMSRGANVDPAALRDMGLLASGNGRIRLIPPAQITRKLLPASANRPSEWSVCLHLAKVLQETGAEAAGNLMAHLRPVVNLQAVREVAYLLYTIADSRGWQQTAAIFNGLGTAWDDLETISRQESSNWTTAELTADDGSPQ